MKWNLREVHSVLMEMCLDVYPADYTDMAIRIEFFGDEIDRITQTDVMTGEIRGRLEHIAIFPASHYVVPAGKDKACGTVN